MKRYLSPVFLLLLWQTANAQFKIVPQSTCVTSGTAAYYGFTGLSWTNSTTMHWSVSGGVFQANNSTTIPGTPLPTVAILWNSGVTSGTVYLYTDNPSTSEINLPVTVTPALQAGTISNASQSTGYGGVPAKINCSPASGGSCGGNYTYQWQSTTSPGTVAWADIAGATEQNLAFSAALTATTYFRRVVTISGGGTSATSNTATVSVITGSIVAGALSPTFQYTNYFQQAPKNIVSQPASGATCTGGDGCYTYQWQQSSSATGTFTDITGANGLMYNPGQYQPTATTYYRLKISSTGMTTVFSTVATINAQTSVLGGPVDVWTGQWAQYSYNGALSTPNWYNNGSDIGSASSGNFTIRWTQPGTHTITLNDGTTNKGTIDVYVHTDPLSAGGIGAPVNTIETGSSFSFVGYDGSGGTCNGSFSYQWESSTDSVNFTPISGANTNGLTVTPSVNTYYRRKISCGSDNAYTSVSQVLLYPYFNPGTLTLGTTDSTAWNTVPLPISGSTPTGGIANGYTYQWYSSTDGTNFTAIANKGQGQNYQPDALAVGTWFYRSATNGSTTRNTTSVYVKVKKVLFDPGTLSPSMLVTNTTTSTSLTGTAATGGTVATYSYQWQQSYDETKWTNCASGNTQNYSAGTLSKTTYYRRLVTNGQQTGYSYVNAIYNVVKVKVVPGLGSAIIPTTAAQSTADPGISAIPVKGYTLASITSAKINYVRTWDVSKPSVTSLSSAKALTSVTDAQQVTEYFDDLGRPIQKVAEDATPDQKDLITVQNYDILGRQVQQYLAYTDNTFTGDFKTDATTKQSAFYNSLYNNTEGFYYSNTIYEASPINRTIKLTEPGLSWTGNNIGIRNDYSFNTISDSVVNWSIGLTSTSYPVKTGYFEPGSLVLLVKTDEHENKTMEYKDDEGKLILSKVQVNDTLKNGHDGWACTYYVYDAFSRLRYVLQPNAVGYALSNNWSLSNSTVQNELCFQYQYDSLSRIVSKRIPGAGITFVIYDKRSRPVFNQDSILRTNNQWQGTLYDGMNREIETGILSYSSGYTALQTAVNNASGNNTTGTLTVSGSTTTTLMPDLYVTSRQTGQTLYQAGNTITFTGELSTETTADFTTQLNVQTQDSFTDTINVLDNTIPSGSTFTPLTITNYDNYSHTSKLYTALNNSIVDNGSNGYAYPLLTQVNNMVKGHVTNVKTRILESAINITQGAWIEKTIFYDGKGRQNQIQSTNSSGGYDTVIVQYSFSGLPLNILDCEGKGGQAPRSFRILTRNNYGPNWKLLSVSKKVDNSQPVIIVNNVYNQIGQIIRRSQGQQRNIDYTYNNAAVDTLDYSYNIRGWMNGINRGYANPTVYATEASAQSDRWFGIELAYDFGFNNKQVNGNVAGVVWKNTSDDEQRAYGFSYDNLNRLTKADFTQNAGSYVWNLTGGIDYSVHSIKYDLNGNILAMNQMGLLLNSSKLIDSLVYSYNSNTNRLNYITDKAWDTTVNLGDFTEVNNNTTQDYWYDGNGNLVKDNNKGITNIHYNHLNLTDSIVIQGKGSVRYVYDAKGVKLKKISYDGVTGKKLITSYVGSGIYQCNVLSSATTYIDTLQYLLNDEGRIRPKTVGRTDTMYYDYFVKDHQRNTRMMLTDELKSDQYPNASLEDMTLSSERLYYSGVDTGRIRKDLVNGYPNDTYTSPNNYVQKLNGNGFKVGMAVLLKVMAGDKITVRANSWWNSTATPGAPVSPVTNIVNALLNSLPAASGAKVMQSQLTTGILTPDVSGFLSTRDTSGITTRPKAYLNVVLLDERLNFVNTSTGANSYFEQVGASGSFPTMGITNRKITKSGYLYIYVSNETPNIDVFFDNLQVTHTRGPLLETDNYYPFGVSQSGISSKAFNSLTNTKQKFQSQEFDADLGLDMYSFRFRINDPKVGRFWQIDPLAEKYLYNSTYAFSENKVTSHLEQEGLETVPLMGVPLAGGHGVMLVQGDVNGDGVVDQSERDSWLQATGCVLGLGLTVLTAGRISPSFYISLLYNPVVQFEVVTVIAGLAGYEGPDIPSPGNIMPITQKILFTEGKQSVELILEKGSSFASVAERKIAQKLLSEGKNVTVLAETLDKTADFLVNGIKTEFKEITNIKGNDFTRAIKKVIEEAFHQATDVIIDVSGQSGADEATMKVVLARLLGANKNLSYTVTIIGDGFVLTQTNVVKTHY